MRIGEVVRFQEERFFNGAVQLGWVRQQRELAVQVASAFVFHGPRYHGADRGEDEDLQASYRLIDTARFVQQLLRTCELARTGGGVNPFVLAIASYGSGKSHLSVTLSETLSDPSGPVADAVIEQICHADAMIGEDVRRRLAAQSKPMLVLPIDGASGSFHLGSTLSQTIFAQLSRFGVDADAIRALSPRFETAREFVERNHGLREQSFAKHLPGRNLAGILAALSGQDEDAFDAVNAVYIEANGHGIPIEGQESAQALLETLATHYCGEQGPFSHVLVLFDELGLYLEHAAEHPERAGARALQEIFQGVQDHRSRIQFLGFIQYELKAYLQRFGSADLRQLQRYLTRFDGAERAYLSSNLETLFASLIWKDETALDRVWRQTDAERMMASTWQRLSMAVPGIREETPWRDLESFSRVVARGCWPLHPLAVWLLTRHSDLIQQRSALALVKQIIADLHSEAAIDGGRLRQVSAAALLHDYLRAQFAEGDRTPGGVVETLLHLLEKHGGRLEPSLRLVMSAVTVLDKLRVRRLPQDGMNALLSECAALPVEAVAQSVEKLGELGVLEWNRDLEQYELLSDGASRGQFQQWLRTQTAHVSRIDRRNIFLRRGMTDCGLLVQVASDFGALHNINTSDWHFDALVAHGETLERSIAQAFQRWREARLPDAAKGQLIYLYLDAEDDPVQRDVQVTQALRRELEKHAVTIAPIWVIGLMDTEGKLGDTLARLAVIDEHTSATEQDRFRRFIEDERDRLQSHLRTLTEAALRTRGIWVAGLAEAPLASMRKTALRIFESVYQCPPPFPFDGFSSQAGNGPRDLSAIAKSLIQGEVNQAWIPAQPVGRRNRIQTVMLHSWQALDGANAPCVPREPALRKVYQTLEAAHQQDPERSLAASYQLLIAPPYGMNAASATLMLALLVGLPRPQRGLINDGKPINAADWVAIAFPRVRARYYLDEAVLARTRLRLFDEDVETRWMRFLDDWETESRIDRIAKRLKEADERLRNEPAPPSLAERLARLRVASEAAGTELMKIAARLQTLQNEIEQAVRRESIQHCLRYGYDVAKIREELSDTKHWPENLTRECDNMLDLAKEIIRRDIASWIPRQTAHDVAQAGDFRRRTESEARWLAGLGFQTEATDLERQATSVLHRLQELQQHALTLAAAREYPFQPQPRENDPVIALREDERRGLEILKNLEAIASLRDVERQAHAAQIQRRIDSIRSVIAQQQSRLGALGQIRIENHEDLLKGIASVEQLRIVFSGDRNEEDVSELARYLQRIHNDISAWDNSDLPPERLRVILADQIERQLAAFKAFIEDENLNPPLWDLSACYQRLAAESVALAKRRSSEWLSSRLALEAVISRMSLTEAKSALEELQAAPRYLSDADRQAINRLCTALADRVKLLLEEQRKEKFAAWRARFPDSNFLGTLDEARVANDLAALSQPPVELLDEERLWRDALSKALTARQDALGLDDLVNRIACLSPEMRAQLWDRLEQIFSVYDAK